MEKSKFLIMVATMRAGGKFSALRKLLRPLNAVSQTSLQDVSAGVFSRAQNRRIHMMNLLSGRKCENKFSH